MVAAFLEAKSDAQMLDSSEFRTDFRHGVRFDFRLHACSCVWIDQQRSHRAYIRFRGQSIAQRIEPARFGHGVVVQQKQQIAPSCACAEVAGRSEPGVGFLAQEDEPFPEQFLAQVGGDSWGVVRRPVVHEQDFEKIPRGRGAQGVQALGRQVPLVPGRDDDGQQRVADHGLRAQE